MQYLSFHFWSVSHPSRFIQAAARLTISFLSKAANTPLYTLIKSNPAGWSKGGQTARPATHLPTGMNGTGALHRTEKKHNCYVTRSVHMQLFNFLYLVIHSRVKKEAVGRQSSSMGHSSNVHSGCSQADTTQVSTVCGRNPFP